jgi:hypothetical protein
VVILLLPHAGVLCRAFPGHLLGDYYWNSGVPKTSPLASPSFLVHEPSLLDNAVPSCHMPAFWNAIAGTFLPCACA